MTHEDMSAVDQEKIDLLVDGELGEAEREAVLRALDADPDGWRRCALTFLEAACWREEFQALLGEPAPVDPPPRHPAGTFRRLGTLLAMAASFVLAFLLGMALRDAWRPAAPDRPRPAEVAAGAPQEGAGGAASGEVQKADSSPPTPTSTAPPWQTVTLAVDKGPGQEPDLIHLPVRQWDDPEDPWRQHLPSAVPAGFLDALRRAGYPFRRARQLVPLRLDDGRQLVFPVEEVEFDYGRSPVIP